MLETPPSTKGVPPATSHRRRWLLALGAAAVAFAGIGVGIAVASRGDTPNQAATTSSQVAMLNQAWTRWLDGGPTANTPSDWCDNMTGWMNQQIANGSMNHQMMWNNPDQMRTTCHAWSNANPSDEIPSNWCDTAVTGMWKHMHADWDHRGDWDNWMTDHPMMGS